MNSYVVFVWTLGQRPFKKEPPKYIIKEAWNVIIRFRYHKGLGGWSIDCFEDSESPETLV